MNNLLGAHMELYAPVNMVALYLMLIFNFMMIKVKAKNLSNVSLKIISKVSKENSKSKIRRFFSHNMFYAVIETILMTFVQWAPIGLLNYNFGKLLDTGANYFGTLLIIPYVLLLYCWIIRIDPLKQIDLITPGYPLGLVAVKIACFFAGCCNGIETKVGMFNSFTGRVEFPVQLLESAVALGIFIFLITWKKELKPGTRLPLYIIIYSSLRFVTEFLRGQENVFGGLKTYHILCLIAIVIGFIQIAIVEKYGDKITAAFTSKKTKKEEVEATETK